VKVLKLLSLLFIALVAMPGAEAAPPQALEPIQGKVIWVDFWASWCVPCRRSFPWMNTMQHKYAEQGLQIIAVNLDKDRALADGFLAEVPAEFSLRFDPAGQLAKQFEVQAMPSSFLLDESGKVLASHFGFRIADTEEYERAIQAALAAAPAKP
jgi:cytochrome c biogenesis protein CcmG, thiol:disulfide interchange protein DsbE